jgi:hypothetical protein
MNREPLRLGLCLRTARILLDCTVVGRFTPKLNLLMAQMLVLNDTSVLYHLNHVTLGAGVASNLTKTVH